MPIGPKVLASVLCLALPALAAAETLTLQVGYGPGGSYDEAARLLADHIGRHLPGTPTAALRAEKNKGPCSGPLCLGFTGRAAPP